MATLYAQPSKEWVVPAKPKPGRKPKRDDVAVDEGVGVSLSPEVPHSSSISFCSLPYRINRTQADLGDSAEGSIHPGEIRCDKFDLVPLTDRRLTTTSSTRFATSFNLI
jgi:hypothetical protein